MTYGDWSALADAARDTQPPEAPAVCYYDGRRPAPRRRDGLPPCCEECRVLLAHYGARERDGR